jgi:hypothetical protein
VLFLRPSFHRLTSCFSSARCSVFTARPFVKMLAERVSRRKTKHETAPGRLPIMSPLCQPRLPHQIGRYATASDGSIGLPSGTTWTVAMME